MPRRPLPPHYSAQRRTGTRRDPSPPSTLGAACRAVTSAPPPLPDDITTSRRLTPAGLPPPRPA
jgi:hypothetical protein